MADPQKRLETMLAKLREKEMRITPAAVGCRFRTSNHIKNKGVSLSWASSGIYG